MASLTFYGGVGEIGGNKILLEDAGKRIWLDFGISYEQANRYFSEFLQPKKYHGGLDLLELGLLPRLTDMGGLYREDYLSHAAIETSDKAAYDAVFLTHAHADHSSYVHYLRRDIPIYASDVTKEILGVVETTSSSGFSDFAGFRETFQLRERKRGGGLMRIRGEEAEASRDFRVIGDNAEVLIGDIGIEAVAVNHSIPGACGYIVRTSEGAVVYTGDLRFHGYGGELTRTFMEKAAEAKPIALICEGTRVDETESITEQDVQHKVCEIMREKRGLVIANYPWKDIERMTSFYEATKSCNRRLAISLKQAYLLKQLKKTDVGVPSLDDENIAIYIDRKNWGLITKPNYPQDIMEQDYDGWEREFLGYPNRVTCADIYRNQSDFVMRIDFFDLTDLINIKPAEGSCYIRSVTEPFDEEAQIELEKVENWLRLFRLYPYEQIHASGHASGPDLLELIKQIQPKVLIPIHTKKPERFKDNLQGTGMEVRIPTYGERMTLS